MTVPVLTRRQLNRATLARQFLLERVDRPVVDTVSHLVGMQAQEPRDPYVGLWSRLRDFDPAWLESALTDREVVRIVVMRGTVHLMTADDAVVLRPLSQPLMEQEMKLHRDHRDNLDGRDLTAAMEFAARLFAAGPIGGAPLRAALSAEFPEFDAASLAFACRNRLAFVQVPPRGMWSTGGPVVGSTIEAWLGRAQVPNAPLDDILVRYLTAFGPASVADARTWCRFTGLREVFERLRPQLRTFRDERGRELFDVPDGPHPDPDVPAPVRILPEYDNVLLSHDDRSRFSAGDDDRRRLAAAPSPIRGTVLADGEVIGGWRIDPGLGAAKRPEGPATIHVQLLRDAGDSTMNEIHAEFERFGTFVAAAGDTQVHLTCL